MLGVLALLWMGTTQVVADPWSDWTAELKRNTALKDEGVKNMTLVRNSACQLKADAASKDACTTLYDTIIARRLAEKQQLLFLLNAVKLPEAQRNAFLLRANETYNRMDADTTALAEMAQKVYPRAQASTNDSR